MYEKIRNFRFALTLLICGCGLILNAQHQNNPKSNKPEESVEQAQRAIFLYLNQPDFYREIFQTNSLPEIDPILRVRDTIVTKGLHEDSYCFLEAMHCDELKYPLTNKTLPLTIPDSLIGKYRYSSPEQDNGLEQTIVYLFSPLLSTNTAEIYLLQYYIWGSSCEEGYCMRFLHRGYLRFRIENKEIVYLEEVDMGEEADDICGFSVSK